MEGGKAIGRRAREAGGGKRSRFRGRVALLRHEMGATGTSQCLSGTEPRPSRILLIDYEDSHRIVIPTPCQQPSQDTGWSQWHTVRRIDSTVQRDPHCPCNVGISQTARRPLSAGWHCRDMKWVHWHQPGLSGTEPSTSASRSCRVLGLSAAWARRQTGFPMPPPRFPGRPASASCVDHSSDRS